MFRNPINGRHIRIKQELTARDAGKARTLAIKNQVKALGADKYDLMVPETAALSYVIHPDETIEGIIYGRYTQESGGVVGRGALIATNSRVVLLDKKPLYVHYDEVIYPAISGVTYTRAGAFGTVILHSKVGDIKVRSLNKKCAKSFVEAIESQILQFSSR